jgi:hypothetical protein
LVAREHLDEEVVGEVGRDDEGECSEESGPSALDDRGYDAQLRGGWVGFW